MSTSAAQVDALHEHQTKTDREYTPAIIQRAGAIRQRVEDRHWQLFEARLKRSSAEANKENYTHPNDYRIIDRLKKVDQPQPPVEPNRRWETFCHQLSNKSNETNRVMSIFHNVWLKNWNTKPKDETQKRRMTDSTMHETTFVEHISTNDNDRKVISSILHRSSSSENFSSSKD